MARDISGVRGAVKDAGGHHGSAPAAMPTPALFAIMKGRAHNPS